MEPAAVDESEPARVRLLRAAAALAALLLGWEALVRLADLPPYLLPAPGQVFAALVERRDLILRHAGITAAEVALGLALGVVAGALLAAALTIGRGVRAWLLPLVVGSQAVPVFALAPLLALWLGYGMAGKIVMAALIVFFPVAAALRAGLARTDPQLLDAARCLGCQGWRLVWRVRLPAALPAFADGLRIAAAIAPIGAVIGEWVGAAAGLGWLMAQSNARLQIDLMFAALLVLVAFAVGLHALADRIGRRLTRWSPAG